MRETKKEKQKSEVNYSPTITGRMKTGLAVSEDQEKWAVCDENTLAELAGALPHYGCWAAVDSVEARWVAKSPHQIPAEMRGRELSHTDVSLFLVSDQSLCCSEVRFGGGVEKASES